MVVYRLLYGAECVDSRLLDLVEPPCQFRVGHALGFCLGVDQPQFVRQGICLGDVGVYVEQKLRPRLLGLRPFLRGLEQEVSAAEEELLEGVAVGEKLRPVLLSGELGLPYLLVLPVHGIPPEPDPQLLDRVKSQLLYVETVDDFHRVREREPAYPPHRPGHVKGHFHDMLTHSHRDTLQGLKNGPGVRTGDYRDYSPLASFGRLVRDDCVQLPVAQARLVNAQPCPDVLRKDEPALGVLHFRPSQVAAQVFLVLPLELVSVYVVWPLKTPCRYRAPVQIYLLKKRQTLSSAVSHLPSENTCYLRSFLSSCLSTCAA